MVSNMPCHEPTYCRDPEDPEPLEIHSPPRDVTEKLNMHPENASVMPDELPDSCAPEVTNHGLVDDGGRR